MLADFTSRAKNFFAKIFFTHFFWLADQRGPAPVAQRGIGLYLVPPGGGLKPKYAILSKKKRKKGKYLEGN